MTERRSTGIASFVSDLKRSREAPAQDGGETPSEVRGQEHREGREARSEEKKEAVVAVDLPTMQHTRQPKKGPGRPAGKSSNPDYAQYSIKIRINTHDTAIENLRMRARRQGSSPNRIDFSDLVEELVAAWNRKQPQ